MCRLLKPLCLSGSPFQGSGILLRLTAMIGVVLAILKRFVMMVGVVLVIVKRLVAMVVPSIAKTDSGLHVWSCACGHHTVMTGVEGAVHIDTYDDFELCGPGQHMGSSAGVTITTSSVILCC